ncbi:hypothetical protein N7512_006427 [Penicillium capsulatum]|nr:hypothetical protein N7512_006427 [Penicillium capsulatum]
MANLALQYRDACLWDKAEVICEEGLDIAEKVLGYDHQLTTGDAEALNMELPGNRQRQLGPEHPSTIYARETLAGIYFALGEFEEAEAHFKEVIEDRKRIIGPTHLGTVGNLRNLATIYAQSGRVQEGMVLKFDALDICMSAYGCKQPSALGEMENLAMAYRDVGQWQEAEALDRQINEMNKRPLGLAHLSTLTSVINVLFDVLLQHRYGEVETILMDVLSVRKRLGQEQTLVEGMLTLQE